MGAVFATLLTLGNPTVKTPSSPKYLFLVLLLLVLLPALFYSAYEINALSSSEELIGDVYRRQLDAVLFSVNQYAWDAASSWANTITNTLASPADTGRLHEPFLRDNPAIQAIMVVDSAAKNFFYVVPNRPHPRPEIVTGAVRRERERIDRLFRLRQSDYRKLEAIALDDAAGADTLMMLAFVIPGSGDDAPRLAGMILDPEAFVRTVLAQKITEGAGDEFVLAVFRRGSPAPVFATGDGEPQRYRQRGLWLFPHLSLAVQLKGTTIEDLVRSRFHRNLVLIVILDVVLLAGAWLVYRTLRREMELVRLKSDFVSNVSHELRTPLSLIRMFAETLQMDRAPTEEKKREYYATILRETERLTRLINNILNFSRMEAGRKQYAFAPLDLNRSVGEVAAAFRDQLRQAGFSLTEEYAPDLPPIRADREAVAEALINMIDNAMKYAAQERSITLRTGSAGTGVFAEVQDRGIGIAPDQQKKIFEKFYRAQDPQVHATKGSGLGLSLVRHIMDAHGGQVTVTSRPGQGSTFRLLFPRHTEEGEHG